MLHRALTIAGWLLALQANEAATAALELTTQERDRLGQLVCGADPESITAVARDTSRPGDYADVQCKPHATHRSHQVAKWARCSRPGKIVVRVFAASGQIVVSSGSHIATLRVPGADAREFELEQISHCDTDTCVPL